MNKKNSSSSLSLDGTEVLKAVAILTVLLIHIISSIRQSPFVSSSPNQLLAITLDQLSRISVPLFVALSGYGLFYKYSKEKLSLGSFFKRRIIKVLPLYIFWSIFFVILFKIIPAWAPSREQPDLLWQLLLGRADYQLYFVPMIFQLYLIFPLILKLFTKWPVTTLIISIAVQLIWWRFFSYLGLTVTSWKYFAEDGEQYLWMTNWIAYFVLGMFLPKIWGWFDKNKLLFLTVFMGFFGSAIYTILNAQFAIQNGVDPLFALKFTRYPLFLYSFSAVIICSYLVAKFNFKNTFLVYLGKVSYPIFLSHTFFLRIVFFLIYL